MPGYLAGATIMIVDDEPFNIEVVRAFLEEDGYRNFVTVSDSTQAMTVLEARRPDLLLLDLMMPQVSGFEVLAAVRAHPKYKFLPVIILTASTDPENKIKALELGATDFLAKPLDPCELGLRVRNTLGAKAYLDQLAYFDPLTSLPNRHVFLDDLSRALHAALRHGDQLALLSIELDNFDHITATMGMSTGDQVLCLVSQRVKEVSRNVDVLVRSAGNLVEEQTLFHLDGCVFSLLLDRIKSAESSAIVAERILRTLSAPMQVEGRDIYLTASIGIATFPASGRGASNLLRLSTSAKDYAKKLGGNTFQFSSTAINEMYEKRLKLETGLRKALVNKEFVLHYQPKVQVQSGAVQGVEALVRWNSEGGWVFPNDFIPLAEETGLIIPLGEWVLAEACRQLQEWHCAGKTELSMAVNLSVKQFADPGLLATIRRIIAESGIDPKLLTLELTESHILGDIEPKIALLNSLKELGVKLSIDDFGTGYSSLSYLRRLPVDELKIDRSFIMEVTDHPETRAIVSTIIFLANRLKLATVAEGVENQEELEFLQTQGCQQYQGYFFSRPVPKAELAKLLSL
jgi:diguanylate cyclase (GGDEF)-like protein